MDYSQVASDPHGYANRLNAASAVRLQYRNSPHLTPAMSKVDAFAGLASSSLGKLPPESTNLLVPKNSLIEAVEASSETIRDAVETSASLSKRLTDHEISLLIGSAISDFQDLLFDTIDTMNIPSAAKAYVANPITFQGRLSREKISMRRSFSAPMFGFRVVFDNEQLNFIESNAEMCCHQLLLRALDTVKVSPSSYGTLLQIKEERNTQARPKLTKPILLNLLGETEKLYGKESLQAVALGALVKCTAGGYPEE